jgi:hypothetical protein
MRIENRPNIVEQHHAYVLVWAIGAQGYRRRPRLFANTKCVGNGQQDSPIIGGTVS